MRVEEGAMNQLRMEDKLCDMVIRVEDWEFNAHKVVLSSCSEYFRVLCAGAHPEKIYRIPSVSSDIMRLVLDHAYNHSAAITMANVKELLVAANKLSIRDLSQECCDFLGSQLCPENCIGIWRFSHLHASPGLTHKAYCYMLQHFEAVVRDSKEFEELPLLRLAALIDEAELKVEHESVVFEAVLRWVNIHNQDLPGCDH